tara:strand:+ start:132 stop:512 length:381 start_codon:yes stop_codon:yes gene_type:complete
MSNDNHDDLEVIMTTTQKGVELGEQKMRLNLKMHNLLVEVFNLGCDLHKQLQKANLKDGGPEVEGNAEKMIEHLTEDVLPFLDVFYSTTMPKMAELFEEDKELDVALQEEENRSLANTSFGAGGVN